MQVGDFIEVEGELQKNPIINYMDSFIDLFRMANIFAEQPQVGGKTQANNQKKKVVVYIIWFFNMIFCECPIVLSCTFWSVLSTVVLLQIENIKRKEFYDEH